MPNLTIDAWLVGASSKHDRQTAHWGTDLDTDVVLSAPIGAFAAGTPVHTVLVSFFDRIVALEYATPTVRSFAVDAFILPCLRSDAVLRRTDLAGSFVLDAIIGTGNSFTLDAWVSGPPVGKAFPVLYAFIIESVQ